MYRWLRSRRAGDCLVGGCERRIALLDGSVRELSVWCWRVAIWGELGKVLHLRTVVFREDDNYSLADESFVFQTT